ncbi:hypothetical protein LTR84_006919 [Exophiala bonariae]|uniref:Nephrocystin 3-like N-terminal domain-containing protein n=1 Tax=Exophiala bonariae TaxID=1690606 RepID=A0AAV9N1B8_9EURO|nr:hypothetical protein LTR84_006919 [Exophiala bonariae]
MAELGLAIAGLASIAEVVGTRLYNYIHIARNAEAEVLTLTEQIDSLRGTLWRIKNLVGNSSFPSDFAAPYLSPVHACVSALDKVRDKLSNFSDREGKDPLVGKRKWKWPFSRSETLDLKNKIQTYETSLGLMLTADNLSTTLHALHESKSSHQILKDVQQYFQAASQIRLDEEKQKLLALVSPTNPLATLKTNVKLWKSGTCTWFTEGPEFKSWLTTENSSLWIYGIPGAGKSILCAQAIQKALSLSDEENAVTYFFCDYKNHGTQKPRNILGSLVEQLARQSKRSYQQLKTFADDYSQATNMQKWEPDCDDLFQLVVQMSENFTSVSLLIDGLDECDEHIVEVTSYLSRLDEASSRFRILLSSRQLVEIQHIVQRFQSLSIAARSTDIRLYIAHELEQRTNPSSHRPLIIGDENLKGEIMDALVSQAHGMFRWVAVQLDYFSELPSDQAIREALTSLPPDLAQSYERLLHMISRKPAATQQLVQHTLMWLASSMQDYSDNPKEALLEALSITNGSSRFNPSNMPSPEKILRACGSLIRFNIEKDTIELAHFTVVEFLDAIDVDIQPVLSRYKTGGHTQWNYLTLTSLTYLCYDDSWPLPQSQEEQNNLKIDHPFLYTAHEMLPACLAKCDIQHEEVLRVVMEFFNQRRADPLLLWLYHEAYKWKNFRNFDLSGLRDALLLMPLMPICYAAMFNLPEVCKRLIDAGQSCNALSPLGTPLQLAIMGRHALIAGSLTFRRSIEESAIDRLLLTLKVLLSYGADVQISQRLFGGQKNPESVLALAAGLIRSTDAPFRELAAAGASCKADCISVMQEIWEDGESIDRLVHNLQYVQEGQVEPSSMAKFRSLRDRALLQRTGSILGTQTMQLVQLDDSPARKVELFFSAAKFDQARALASLGHQPCFDVNVKNDEDETVLHVAARHGSSSAMKTLLELPGIDTTIRDKNGNTALHIALAMRVNMSIIKMLRDVQYRSKTIIGTSNHEHGARVGGPQTIEDLEIRERRKNVRMIYDAIEIGDQNVIDLIYSEDSPVFSPCQICGECDLFIHALTHDEHIAFRLLKRGYKVIGVQDPRHHGYARTALHICAEKGHLRLLEAILDRAPFLLFLDTEVHPIHLAILHNQNECLRVILDRRHACWNSVHAGQGTLGSGPQTLVDKPFMPTLQTDRKFRFLESSDLSIIALRPRDFPFGEAFAENLNKFEIWTYGVLLPLHCAALVGNEAAAQQLLEAGSKKDCIPPGGVGTALSIAISQGALEIAEILLEHGASLYHYSALGESGVSLLGKKSPEMFLRHCGSFDLDVHPDLDGEGLIAQLVRSVGQRFLPSYLELMGHARELHGHSRELHDSTAQGYSVIRDVLATRSPAVIDYALNSGFDLGAWNEHSGGALNGNWVNEDIQTLKRLTRRIGYQRSTKLLNKKPAQTSTPLYKAALMGQQEVARFFMKHGAGINVIGGLLGTPLMAAAGYGRLCIVKDFVNAGAELSCFSIDENRVRSAVDLAKYFPDIQRWLLVERWTERKRITWEEASE